MERAATICEVLAAGYRLEGERLARRFTDSDQRDAFRSTVDSAADALEVAARLIRDEAATGEPATITRGET